jgi:hypothetical protein
MIIALCNDPLGISITSPAHVPPAWHKAAAAKVLQAVQMDFSEVKVAEDGSRFYIFIEDADPSGIGTRLGFWHALYMDVLLWCARKAASELPLPVTT